MKSKKFNPMMTRVKRAEFNIGWFYDPVYRANVELLWPVNGKQVSRYIKRRYGIDHDTGDSFGAKCIEIYNDERDVNIICLRAWNPRRASDISILAHEVFHCAEHILGRRDVRLHADFCTEPYAYLIESIMRRCLYLLKP